MSYRTRSTRRIVKKTKRNLVATIIIIILLVYTTLNWILPTFIGGIDLINNIFNKGVKTETSAAQNPQLAPPVFNIPYEATSTAEVNISGYATTKSRVELYVDDNLKDTTEVNEDGSFIFKEVKLLLGINNIFGKSIDENDQKSLSSKIIKVIYDNEKPSLEVFEPADGKMVQGEKKIKVSGKTDSNAQIFVNGNRVIVNQDGEFSTDQILKDGENNITIRAQDEALNTIERTHKVIFQP